jgi:hypothetical protein
MIIVYYATSFMNAFLVTSFIMHECSVPKRMFNKTVYKRVAYYTFCTTNINIKFETDKRQITNLIRIQKIQVVFIRNFQRV